VPARLQPTARRLKRHPRRLALPIPRHARGHQQLARPRAPGRAKVAGGRGDGA
jgi:hypothetical protein